LGLKIFDQKDKSVLMGYSEDQAKLEFEDIGEYMNIMYNLILIFYSIYYYYIQFCMLGTEVNHAKAYGRIAFSVPFSEQPMIQKTIKESGNKILTDLITLDTPGKASVRVIILADPVSIYILLLTKIFYQSI